MNKIVNLSESNYGVVKDNSYSMAILPWGATEPHNYHLPYITDSILSRDISVDAATIANQKGYNAMVLPPVYMGSQNPGQREFPFCIHSRYETQVAILRDIIDSLSHQNINKLLIVNGHGGNSFNNMLRDIAVDRPEFMLAVCNWFSIVSLDGYFENGGEHAHELESSVMLHYHEDLVDMNSAGVGEYHEPNFKPLREKSVWMPRNWAEISTDTGIGNPLSSTKERGERYAKAVCQKLSQIIVEMSTYCDTPSSKV